WARAALRRRIPALQEARAEMGATANGLDAAVDPGRRRPRAGPITPLPPGQQLLHRMGGRLAAGPLLRMRPSPRRCRRRCPSWRSRLRTMRRAEAWLSTERLEAEIAWWKERLAGGPAALALPADRPRPLRQMFRGAAWPVSLP